jgi:hypothetical protein
MKTKEEEKVSRCNVIIDKEKKNQQFLFYYFG